VNRFRLDVAGRLAGSAASGVHLADGKKRFFLPLPGGQKKSGCERPKTPRPRFFLVAVSGHSFSKLRICLRTVFVWREVILFLGPTSSLRHRKTAIRCAKRGPLLLSGSARSLPRGLYSPVPCIGGPSRRKENASDASAPARRGCRD